MRHGGGGASKTVLVSGAPDMIDEDHAFERLAAKYPAILKELEGQDAALDGKRGAKMWAVNVEIGVQSACQNSPAQPSGMASAAQVRVMLAP